MIDIKANQNRVVLIGFCLVLALAWFCYRPALSGAFQLDDVANLSGLADVEDLQSVIDFTLSGTAGPTGRPLALLTFALQAEHWDTGAAAFLRLNIMLHLLNAVILAWCLYRLALLSAVQPDKAVVVASATASAWVLMPLLATASLLVVQRMTTLCALFMLLGLAGYLTARGTINFRPGKAMAGMSMSLVVATALATLCKESGLLLPVFVLVLEATVLDRPTSITPRLWRIWHSAFLLLPLVLLLAYLASRSSYPDWLVARRDFNAWERLLTEAQILWLYLQKALLGIPGQLGIYQDAPVISRALFNPLTFFSGLAWLALLSASVAWRRRYPLLALSVLWYLAGHMIESTVVPLELYFEHRNYVAIIGPLFALCSFVLLGSMQLRRIAAVTIPAFLLLSAYFLHSFASLWGDPSAASRYWALRYPGSVRAVTVMATYQLAEEGPLRTLQTLDQFVLGHPGHAYLRILELNLLCMFAGDQDHSRVLEQLDRELPKADFTYTAGTMLSQLFTTSVTYDCNGVAADTVAALAGKLHGNPRYKDDPQYNQFHFKLLAGIARKEHDYPATIDNLRRAIEYRPSSELNMMMVTALGGAGEFAAAYAFIEDAETRRPANPMRAIMWQRDLDGLRLYISELEQYSKRDASHQLDTGTETEEP